MLSIIVIRSLWDDHKKDYLASNKRIRDFYNVNGYLDDLNILVMVKSFDFIYVNISRSRHSIEELDQIAKLITRRWLARQCGLYEGLKAIKDLIGKGRIRIQDTVGYQNESDRNKKLLRNIPVPLPGHAFVLYVEDL